MCQARESFEKVSAFLKYRHMGDRDFLQKSEIYNRITTSAFKKGGVHQTGNLRKDHNVQLHRDDHLARDHKNRKA